MRLIQSSIARISYHYFNKYSQYVKQKVIIRAECVYERILLA